MSGPITKGKAWYRLLKLPVFMQAESSLSRESSENEGGESEPSTHTQGPSSASQEAEKDQAEQVGIFLPLLFYTRQHITYLQPAHHLRSNPSQWFCFILFRMRQLGNQMFTELSPLNSLFFLLLIPPTRQAQTCAC